MIRKLILAFGLLFAVSASADNRRIEISVTDKGFSPDHFRVKKGEAVTLAFKRETDKTCAKQVILQLGDGQKVERKRPLGETVLIEATFAKTGELRYGCKMDMITGVITVE